MEQTTQLQSNKINWYDFILPIVLIALAIFVGWYILKYPTDNIVANYVTLPKIKVAVWQHLYLIVISSALAIATSVPLGMVLTRKSMRYLCGTIVSIVNFGQTIPSFAVIALCFGVFGIGAKSAIFALWLYSLLPILNNTIAGLRSVDPNVIDAARGMGMTKLQILFRIEMPLAMPVIFAGIRTAIVINVATAIIAAFVGAGGLGDFIIAGKNINRMQIMLLGAGYATMLALILDSILAMIEKKVSYRF